MIFHPRRALGRVRAFNARRLTKGQRHLKYQRWFETYSDSARDIESQQREIAKFKHRPLISIILPLYNTPHDFLRECIDSVIGQSYTNWELCITDDASSNDVESVVRDYQASHNNIKFIRLEKNMHITGASNAALALAQGEFIALLDHDDLLMPNALFESAKVINQEPLTDLIYSDEDKFEAGRGHTDPFFKPDWSPDFLYSCNYITHFAVIRTKLVEKVGGFRHGTEGAQDWDLFLRLTQVTKNIWHIPKILYSWRLSATSTAKSSSSKPYAYINQLRVLRDSLAAMNTAGSVFGSSFMGFWRVRYYIKSHPLVSIIIPTKDNYELIKTCVESVIEKTTYPYFEIVLVDTGTTDSRVLELYQSNLFTNNPIKVVSLTGKFNFSGACNFGAKQSSGEYLLFLNNDTEVISPEWVENLLEHAQRPEIGMVGCRLWFPDGRLQHVGVILSDRDVAFNSCYGQDPTRDIFKNIYVSNIRNCAAVTAACAMVERSKFDRVGGFEEKLRVTYNDVDICLKLLGKGYYNLYTPYAELYHHESVSVGRINTSSRDTVEFEEAVSYMRQRWGDILKRDPYYNDNFNQFGPGYELP
jgi:GT2 family glycosyltransferase